MTTRINIRNINIHLHETPQGLGIPGLLALAPPGSTCESARESPIALPAQINEELQGGIYAGPAIEDGKLIHLIAAPEGLGDLSWEDAKKAAAEYRGGGFDDWELPSKPHLQTAQANGLDLPKVRHWTGSPFGSSSAWAVDFESGGVSLSYRDYEFRVRPFRRLSL